MDSLTGQVLIIMGLVISLGWAWRRINRLEVESRDHFKQIDDLRNQVAKLQLELQDKKVIDEPESDIGDEARAYLKEKGEEVK